MQFRDTGSRLALVADWMRRTRWWVVVALGVPWVLLPTAGSGSWLRPGLMVIATVFMGVPGLVSIAHALRSGYLDEAPQVRKTNGG